jgi:hypothetical protein
LKLGRIAPDCGGAIANNTGIAPAAGIDVGAIATNSTHVIQGTSG